jgi:competence protein ComEA
MDPAPPPVLPPTPPAQPTALLTGWSNPVQLALAFLLGTATTLLVIQSFGFWRWGGRPGDLDQKPIVIYRINLNHADRAELMQLPGVGTALAQRIEDHRSRAGRFRNIDELRDVEGIGPATLEQLRPWVYVDARDGPVTVTAPEKPMSPAPAPIRGPTKVADPKEPINLNEASAEELQRLPGIGPKLSQRIVEERQRRPFKSVDDLDRVNGIGPKTIERLRPYVTTEGWPAPLTDAG